MFKKISLVVLLAAAFPSLACEEEQIVDKTDEVKKAPLITRAKDKIVHAYTATKGFFQDHEEKETKEQKEERPVVKIQRPESVKESKEVAESIDPDQGDEESIQQEEKVIAVKN